MGLGRDPKRQTLAFLPLSLAREQTVNGVLWEKEGDPGGDILQPLRPERMAGEVPVLPLPLGFPGVSA